MSGAVRYNAVAMILHWLTALTVIGLLVVGNIMTDMPKSDPLKLDLYNWHKSFGIVVLFLTVIRFGWRLIHKPPALPEEMPDWEKRAAHITHWVFYALLLGVPFLGWIAVSTSSRHIPTILFDSILWPHLPFLSDMEAGPKHEVHEAAETLHAVVAYAMAALVVLHIGAALRHRIVLKDTVAQRMLPKIVPVLLIAAGLGGAAPSRAADWTVDPGKSVLGFSGAVSGKVFEGRFKTWQAEIVFDPANLTNARAKVTIDMASATTADRQRDAALPDTDWFYTKKFPQAVFEAANFTAKGNNQYEAVGTLSIRGIKKDVTMPFTLDITGDDAHAKGKLDISRTDYGVGQGEWADASTVALGVSISFDLLAKKKP